MNGETIQLHIRSAKDLFDAVKSPDPAVLLRRSAGDGAEPRQGGIIRRVWRNGCCRSALRAGGRAFPSLSPDEFGSGDTRGGSATPRTAALFKKELSMAQDAEIITLAARFLSSEPEGDVHALFSSFLMQDNSPPHARAAANAMAGFTGLVDAERIGSPCLPMRDFDAPLLDEHTEAFWLKELAGPWGAERGS